MDQHGTISGTILSVNRVSKTLFQFQVDRGDGTTRRIFLPGFLAVGVDGEILPGRWVTCHGFEVENGFQADRFAIGRPIGSSPQTT